MKASFDKVSIACGREITKAYSTSFSMGVRFLSRDMRAPIHGIYGFVRTADEIVDSFHGWDRLTLLNEFEESTYRAIERGISTNPVLNAFQAAVNRYNIDLECIDSFLRSMRMDLAPRKYTHETYNSYILGSAEVVGLMCLKVFLNGDEKRYLALKPQAMKLGAAFQKINFLRDLKEDYRALGRTYFPEVNLESFSNLEKQNIEASIESDLNEGFEGVKKLPRNARFGVYVAYILFRSLFYKIRASDAQLVLRQRVRIGNSQKAFLFLRSYFRHRLNLL